MTDGTPPAGEARRLVEVFRRSILSGLFGVSLRPQQISEQGSLSRNTFAEEALDIDLLVVEPDRPKLRRLILVGRSPGFEGELRRAVEQALPGYAVSRFRSRWIRAGYLFRFDLVGDATPLGVDLVLAPSPPPYLELYQRQRQAVAVLAWAAGDPAGGAGQVAALEEDIRRCKRLLRELGRRRGFPYRTIDRGIGGVGAEQLVVQAGGSKLFGTRLVKPGGFGRAMLWVYSGRTDCSLSSLPALSAPPARIRVFVPRAAGLRARLAPGLPFFLRYSFEDVIRRLPRRHYETLWRVAKRFAHLCRERQHEPIPLTDLLAEE